MENLNRERAEFFKIFQDSLLTVNKLQEISRSEESKCLGFGLRLCSENDAAAEASYGDTVYFGD